MQTSSFSRKENAVTLKLYTFDRPLASETSKHASAKIARSVLSLSRFYDDDVRSEHRSRRTKLGLARLDSTRDKTLEEHYARELRSQTT
jgi:hypothetical protein